MVSKEQERKALNEIKEILLQLEPDGYVRTAFDGCFQIAEDNINNDFACSMKQRAESAERQAQQKIKEAEASKAEIKRLEGINKEMRRDLEGTEQTLANERKQNAEEISRLNGIISECHRDLEGTGQQIADLKAEIIRLKAQVYDLTF